MRTGAWRGSPGDCDVHDHVCWVFDDDAEWAAAATTFLADGAARHERLYYGATGSPAERRAHLAGLEGRDALMDSAALRVFDARVMAAASDAQRENLIRVAAEQAVAEGYRGVRFAVDSTCVAPGDDWDAQARWERRSDRLCLTLPLSALCGVNRSVLSEETVAAIACLHPSTGGCGEAGPFSVFAIDGGVALAGEIDAAAATALDRALAHEAPGPGESVLDLAGVGFVDGRGLATIAGHADRLAAAGGMLVVTGASPLARRIWELCAFDRHPAARLGEEQPA